MDPRIRIHPKMSWICNTGFDVVVCSVFMKLELEEKGRVAESYRIDNYKLLQRLEAVVKREPSHLKNLLSFHKFLNLKIAPRGYGQKAAILLTSKIFFLSINFLTEK
jgi:hypothetical protein